MALNMDELTRYLKPVPRHTWVWWLISTLLIAGSIWGAMEAYRLHELSLEQQEQLAVLQRSRRVLPPPKPTRAALEAERRWAALRQERSFSWYPLFAALEKTSHPDIALLEFVPDKSAGTLTLRGSARTIEALTEYLSALAKETAFQDVYLAQQKKIQQGALFVTSFEIRMQLRHTD